jgi:hypothetical protein
MIDTVQPGEIIFCDMHLRIKDGTTKVVKQIIWAREWDEPFKLDFRTSNEKDCVFLRKHKITKDAKVVKLNIISRHGFKNKNI